MSKKFNKELSEVDERIARIKGYIQQGHNMYHMLRYFEKKRLDIVDKIGRKTNSPK